MVKRRKPVLHHVDTTEHSIKPKDDIGPAYSFIGVVVILGGVGVILWAKLHGHKIEWPDVAVYALVFIAGIFLLRPDKLDSIVKAIADKLPFIKYQKPEDGGE